MKHRGIKAWMQKFFCSCVSTASPAGCPCVWNSSVQSQRCLCHTVWERHSHSKASTASVCPSPGHTGPLCPGGYFWGHLKPVQLGSPSGFKGHLKAAISSKETGCSHAGWPKKLILFHEIKEYQQFICLYLRKEMDCMWSCKVHIWQTKQDEFQLSGKTCFPSFNLFNDGGNEAKWVTSLRIW